jgi:hypothetical protein
VAKLSKKKEESLHKYNIQRFFSDNNISGIMTPTETAGDILYLFITCISICVQIAIETFKEF